MTVDHQSLALNNENNENKEIEDEVGKKFKDPRLTFEEKKKLKELIRLHSTDW